MCFHFSSIRIREEQINGQLSVSPSLANCDENMFPLVSTFISCKKCIGALCLCSVQTVKRGHIRKVLPRQMTCYCFRLVLDAPSEFGKGPGENLQMSSKQKSEVATLRLYLQCLWAVESWSHICNGHQTCPPAPLTLMEHSITTGPSPTQTA